MAVSFPRPDPSSPSAVSSASFPMARRGYDPDDVRNFLRMVAAELARLQERERMLERELRNGSRATGANVALDEEIVTRMLGEEAARILATARDAAAQIKARAEEGASRLLREATDEAHRMREEAELESARRRQDAAADSEAEIEMAKQQGRDMVNEAREYREKVLSDLARRRELARQQIEAIVHGRERLIQSFERARVAAVDVMAELGALSEPDEYVNLTPTTGPVPLMVPAAEARVRPEPVPEPEPQVAVVEAAIEVEAEEIEAVVEVTVEPEPEVVDVVDEVVDVVEPEPIVATEPVLTIVESGPQIDEVDDEHDAAVEHDPVDEAAVITGQLPVIPSAPQVDDTDDDEDTDDGQPVRLAKVVSLFAGELPGRRGAPPPPPSAPQHDEEIETIEDSVVDAPAEEPVVEEHVAEEHVAERDPAPRRSADELFARLRAARTDDVVKAVTAEADSPADTATTADTDTDTTTVVATVAPVEAPAPASPPAMPPVFRSTDERSGGDEPPQGGDDTPFTRRDAVLTPLIVASARKLKRVLADEQNDVLHVLRRKERITDLDALLPPAPEHVARYADAVHDDLTSAALAGAASLDDSASDVHRRRIEQHHALAPSFDTLSAAIIEPLRERLDSAVRDASDNAELAEMVRGIYREWKTQRIDEQLDDVVRTAFGRGAFVVLTPGTLICWTVDPNGPACADAEDNTLGGVIGAGERFPTEHVCAPAHEGCRCMLQRAPLS